MCPVPHRAMLAFDDGSLDLEDDIVFLLRDTFVTPDAAPLTDPRVCEPGPGSFDVDGADYQYITGGTLKGADSTGDSGIIDASAQTLAAGLLFGWSGTFSGQNWFGLKSTGSTVASYATLNPGINGGNVSIRFTDVGIVNISNNFSSRIVIAYTTSTVHIFNWKAGKGWVREFIGGWTAGDYYYQIQTARDGLSGVRSTTKEITIRSIDESLITQGVSVSGTGAGAATDEDFIFRFVMTTVPSSGSFTYQFRIQDNDNYWELEINSSGDILLNEVVATTPTEQSSSLAAVTDGEVVVLIADGTTIKVYVNATNEWSYSSASNFKSEKSFNLTSLGTGGAISGGIIHERYPQGRLMEALQISAPAESG